MALKIHVLIFKSNSLQSSLSKKFDCKGYLLAETFWDTGGGTSAAAEATGGPTAIGDAIATGGTAAAGSVATAVGVATAPNHIPTTGGLQHLGMRQPPWGGQQPLGVKHPQLGGQQLTGKRSSLGNAATADGAIP